MAWLIGWYYTRPRPRVGGTEQCTMEFHQYSGKKGGHFRTEGHCIPHRRPPLTGSNQQPLILLTGLADSLICPSKARGITSTSFSFSFFCQYLFYLCKRYLLTSTISATAGVHIILLSIWFRPLIVFIFYTTNLLIDFFSCSQQFVICFYGWTIKFCRYDSIILQRIII